MNRHAAELLPQIQAALTGVSPLRQLTDAEEKTFHALLKKIERLGESLREANRRRNRAFARQEHMAGRSGPRAYDAMLYPERGMGSKPSQ